MKITQPRLANVLKEDFDVFTALAKNEDDLTEYSFKNQKIEDLLKNGLSVQSCHFTNCILTGCKIKKSQFSDVIFKNCDLSNITISDSGFHRVEFIDCKLMGTNLSDGTFNHVIFSNCKTEYVNLSISKLRTVLFQQCDMRGGGLENCQFTDTAFESCNLMEAEFYRTSLKGVDLSTSEIVGLRIGAIASSELRGVSVTSLQALELVRLLGVSIKG